VRPLTPSFPSCGWAFPASHCSLWSECPSSTSLVGTGAMPALAARLGPALRPQDAARDLPSSALCLSLALGLEKLEVTLAALPSQP